MRVSFNNYARMNEFLRPAINKEMDRILSLDSDAELFKYQYENEKRIGKVLGKGYAAGLSSGTAALQLSLAGLGIGKGDEVITVPNTFIATLLSISNTGASPVLVDIDKDTMLMDIEKIEDSITENTRAILPVHLYGQMADVAKIKKIADKHGLFVIEDACHAHLARYDDKLPGTYSDSACYSFFPSKGLGGISNGGMVITKNKGLHKDIEILRNPASNDPLLLKSLRTPAYLDWIEIAFIKSRMKYLNSWTEKRREAARKYSEALEGLPVEVPVVDRKAYHVFRDYVVRTDKRDRLKKYLARHGIETDVHYPLPVHLSRTYRSLGYRKGDLPSSEKASSEVLSLPISPFLSDDESGYVIENIRKFF